MLRSSSTRETARPRVIRLAGKGALAGLVGGVVFLLLWLLILGPKITLLLTGIAVTVTRSQSPLLGFFEHFAISAIFGAIYAVVLGNLVTLPRYGSSVLFGLLDGVIWWVLGALVISPLLIGQAPLFAQAFSPPLLVDLVAHLLYGVVTALVFTLLVRRAEKVQGERSL